MDALGFVGLAMLGAVICSAALAMVCNWRGLLVRLSDLTDVMMFPIPGLPGPVDRPQTQWSNRMFFLALGAGSIALTVWSLVGLF